MTINYDILRGGDGHNLTHKVLQDKILTQIRNGDFHLIVAAPPCNTWSRARHSSTPGPSPLRCAQWPDGFPWLTGKAKREVESHNELALFTFRCLQQGWESEPPIPGLLEHPEDLGTAPKGDPASIWHHPQTANLIKLGFERGAIFQCHLDANLPYSKPTGLLTTIPEIIEADFFFAGPPVFEHVWRKGRHLRLYRGPLPASCGHTHEGSLLTKETDGSFRTSSTAAYPANMCKTLARLIAAHLYNRCLCRTPTVRAQPPGAGASAEGAEGNAVNKFEDKNTHENADEYVDKHRDDSIDTANNTIAGDECPMEAWLDPPRRMQLPAPSASPQIPKDAIYIGRGCAQRGLEPSEWANPFTIAGAGSRHKAIREFRAYAERSPALLGRLQELGGKRLACHCHQRQACHGDVLVELYLAQKANATRRPPEDHEAMEAAAARKRANQDASGKPPPLESDDEEEEPVANRIARGQIAVGSGDKRRILVDGGGLCSRGLWRPADRPQVSGICGRIGGAILESVTQFLEARGTEAHRVVADLAAGRTVESPFPAEMIVELRGKVRSWLAEADGRWNPIACPREQPVDVALLGAILRNADDPDWRIMQELEVGVRLGVGVRLPRTPGV